MKKMTVIFALIFVVMWLSKPIAASEIVLQPGPEDGMDCWFNDAFNYHLDNEWLWVGGWGDNYYALIKFDVSGLPSEITSAKIYLYCYQDDDYTNVSMYLDRVTSSWDESTQWSTRPSFVNLGVIPTPIDGQWYSIDITDLYRGWKDGRYVNYGIQLRPTSSNKQRNTFHSSDYMTDSSLRPKLVLELSSGDVDQTATGFYYPLGTAEFDSECGTWLARDPNHGGCYFRGYYHIGFDMMADYDSPVYPISNGTVEYVSPNGWGRDNVGVFVRHTLSDGSEFLALYAHIRTSVMKYDPVIEGKEFAKIGHWLNGDHLHFGIVPDTQMPISNPKEGIGFGRMTNPNWPSTNGFVDPIDFINTYSPD
jgi:murein DD-endopeptidase MepM/ murein hydrolase activator NlpD